MASETQRSSQTGQYSDSRSNKTAVQDAREYARLVSDYSKLTPGASLFAGGHFENLAAYLSQPFNPRAPNLMLDRIGGDRGQYFKFITIYDLNPAAARKPKHMNSISEFEQEASSLVETSPFGHLVFMRGHPSPEWLLAIGTQYQIDPEYFQRHLDFFLGQPEHFPLPSLPSTGSQMIRLKLITVGGSQSSPQSSNAQEELEALQISNAKAKQAYREQLRTHADCSLGDSVVRDCSIHDLCHFSIEQDIFINTCKTKKSWACIIWLDVGESLSEGPTAALSMPLQRKDSWQIRYLPIVQHKSGVSLRQRSKLLAPVSATQRGQNSSLQSASLLHLDYGRSLDRHMLATEPFYALHELFVFSAFSEAQFLNMVESKLDQELEHSALVGHKNATISNLVYHQRVLDRRIIHLRETLTSIADAVESYQAGDINDRDKQREAVIAANMIRRDYQFLLDRASSLLAQCDRGVQIVMNNAMIKESREAMVQAEGVVKLTRLAFLFIPLSFTTSFFGMNFKEFGSGVLRLWVWAIVSVPVVTAALALMRYDLSSIFPFRGQQERPGSRTAHPKM